MGSNVFVKANEQGWVDLEPGLKRRLLGHNEGLMMVEVAFEKDVVGAMHSHPHLQVCYVAKGAFEVTIGEEKTVLSAGDSFIVPSNLEHGVLALEAGTLIDVFTPAREDFIE